MNVGSFIKILTSLQEAAELAGDTRCAAELEQLRALLIPHADNLINATSTKRIRTSVGSKDLKMRFARAFAFLNIFQRGVAEVGRAQDVKALQGLVSALEDAPANNNQRPTRSRTDAARVAELSRELKDAEIDRDRFNSAFRTLSEENLNLKSLNCIALEYTEDEEPFRSKLAALKAIKARFESRVQRARKDAEIERLTRRKKT